MFEKSAAFLFCALAAAFGSGAYAQAIDLQRACRDQYGADHQAQLQPPGGPTDWRCVRAVGGDALDSFLVPNDRPLKVQSNIVLERGRWYVLEASGVVTDWNHVKEGVDAVWCYADWRCGKGEAWNQLRVDDKGLSDIAGATLPYNAQHVYRVRIQGQGRPLVAHSSDAQSSWGDNAGAFTLKIYRDGAVQASVPAAPTGRSYTSQPRAVEAVHTQPGRSYTARPRTSGAVQAQPAPGSAEEALKKAVEGAIKGLFKR